MSRIEAQVEAAPLISICIPTYRRADLFRQALQSCFAQTYSSIEIVIGDDSTDDATEAVIGQLTPSRRAALQYCHHLPSLGQNRNVNDLFQRARGSRLVLLHDDDILLPDAVQLLAALWEKRPALDVAFGKQYLIEQNGTAAPPISVETLNSGYGRIHANAGRQMIPVIAGITRMFPNDGYMVSTALARSIGYRPMEEVGHACDTDFGLRLCAAARELWFLDEFTMKYRMSEESISKHSIVDPYTYDMLSKLTVPPAATSTLDRERRAMAPGAVSGFARMGWTRRAWEVFCSTDYPVRKRLSARGAYHLFLILRSVTVKKTDGDSKPR